MYALHARNIFVVYTFCIWNMYITVTFRTCYTYVTKTPCILFTCTMRSRRCQAPDQDDHIDVEDKAADKYCHYFKDIRSKNVFNSCLNRLSAIARKYFYGQCVCNVQSMSNYLEIRESVCDLMTALVDECEYFKLILINWRKIVNCGRYPCAPVSSDSQLW